MIFPQTPLPTILNGITLRCNSTTERLLTSPFLPFQSYLDFFANSLRSEYKDQGITFQVLKPHFIADGVSENTIPGASFLVPTPARYAKAAVSTLGWDEESTGYWVHTLQVRS